MYKKIRIICAVISALFLVVILPAATFWGLNGLAICGFGAGLFFSLMLIFKKAQFHWEEKHGIPHDVPSETPIAEEDIQNEEIDNKETNEQTENKE